MWVSFIFDQREEVQCAGNIYTLKSPRKSHITLEFTHGF